MAPTQKINPLEDREGGITREEKRQIFSRLDETMCKKVVESIMDEGPGIQFDDIIGLADVKQSLIENIIYP